MKKITFKKEIIPQTWIINSKVYKLTRVNPKYIINKFSIITNDDEKIENIFIESGIHPNCCPEDGNFCIPDFLRNLEINDQTMNLIINMLMRWDDDSSYFWPTDVDRRDVNSKNIQQNLLE